MFEIREKPEMVERAMLVSIYFDPSEAGEKQAMLDELEDLVSNLGIGIAGKHLVKSRDMHAKFLCGTGKAQEVKQLALDCRADCVVFDNMLSPSQQREWERLVDECVIDREEVILDIFARRARTREATLQVELARMQYSLPRMARMWNHLDRQGGGSGGGKGGGGAARGEGEKQIEVDRRLARARIEAIQRELVLVTRQRATQRKERERQAVATAAIVGYTNAGKSSLLSLVSGSEVMARDMLFATLDTTTRKIELPHGQPLLLTDTVGFIRNLPHRLVEAFKSTLEEAVLGLCHRQRTVLRGRYPAGLCVSGQPRLLQVPVPCDGVLKAHELFFPGPYHLRQEQMRVLRAVQKGVPHGGGHDGQLPPAGQRHGVHSVHGMREELPQGGAVRKKSTDAKASVLFFVTCCEYPSAGPPETWCAHPPHPWEWAHPPVPDPPCPPAGPCRERRAEARV